MTTFEEARDIVDAWGKQYGFYTPDRDWGIRRDALASKVALAITERELKLDAIAEILKDK